MSVVGAIRKVLAAEARQDDKDQVRRRLEERMRAVQQVRRVYAAPARRARMTG